MDYIIGLIFVSVSLGFIFTSIPIACLTFGLGLMFVSLIP